MKTLLIDRDWRSPMLMPPEATLMADSAITPPGRPVFLPDFSDQWEVEFYLTVKISRLGKMIALKFADRYFEQITVAMRLVPSSLQAELAEVGRPQGIVSAFDNALTLGTWIDADVAAKPLTVSINGMSTVIDDAIAQIRRTIVDISSYCTLKTGDLIMPLRLGPAIAAGRGSQIKVEANGSELLSLTIK